MDCPAKVIHMSNVNSTYHQKERKEKKTIITIIIKKKRQRAEEFNMKWCICELSL